MKHSVRAALLVAAIMTAGFPHVWAETELPIVPYLKIRLGIPVWVRGPEDNDDAAFTALMKKDGTINGYIAKGPTFLIPGASSVMSMGGNLSQVINVGAISGKTDCTTAPDSGGNWMNTVQRVGNTWYGLVHSEGPCDYAATQTTKSMAMFSSTDEGTTWTPVSTGTILSDGSTAATGQINGEGDYGMIPGPDGNEYAYGGRYTSTNWSTVRARAPLGALGAGNWLKYSTGNTFSVTGVGGTGENMSLGWTGTYPASIPGVAPAVMTGSDHTVYFGPYYSYTDKKFYAANQNAYTISGISLAISRDMVNFSVLHDPLMPYDAQIFNGRGSNVGSDLLVYAALLNDRNGSRILDQHHFNLSFTYVPPFRDINTRYVIMTPVTLSVEMTPQYPTVAQTIARYKPASGAATTATYLTTTFPVVDPNYTLDTAIAFMPTDQPTNGAPVQKIEECKGASTVSDDYLMDADGSCATAGYTRLRTAGYLFVSGGKNLTAIYSCKTASGAHFLSKDNACEGIGSNVATLGYALTN